MCTVNNFKIDTDVIYANSLTRAREVKAAAAARVRGMGWHAGFGMNGGNSRTINDNYGALAAIRNT